MFDTLVDYFLFIGMALYFAAGVMFLYLFSKTQKIKDGTGLSFLRLLTFALSVGSFTIFTIRILSEYGPLEMLTARALAIVNPILLLAVALYLNHLFSNSEYELTKKDNQNIKDIKADTKESNANIKIIKHDMIKRPGVK